MKFDDLRDRHLDMFCEVLLGKAYGLPEVYGIEPGVSVSEALDDGLCHPKTGYTMVGMKRLRQLREAIAEVVSGGIQGDLVETGVWRGGSCMLMREALNAWGESDRKVWVCDSFEGFPKELMSKNKRLASLDYVAVSLEEVRGNFERFGLTAGVEYLKGWFSETFREPPFRSISILRLDGDLYESTMDVFRGVYDLVSPGGFVIVDDYNCIEGCKRATNEFRQERGITAPMIRIDRHAEYWRK